MPLYWVEVPICGKAVCEVLAASKDDAIGKVISQASFRVDIKCEGDIQIEVDEIELLRDAVRGNVTYLPLTHANATLVRD